MGVTEQDNINSSMSAEGTVITIYNPIFHDDYHNHFIYVDAVVTEMILATERVQKALMANNASDGDECDKQRADSNESSVPQPTKAEYTFEKNVPYIPCVMEEGFKPSGGLAILKRARNRISFFPPENFDRSFAELATEIEYIEAELNEKCHENLSDRINAIISDYKSSINKSHLQLQHLTKKELFKLMERFCKEIAPETSQIFQNENSYNNDDNSIQNQEEFYHWIMKYLLKQDERLTAVIRTQQEQEKNFAAVTQCLLHHNDEMKTSSIYLSPSLD
ncbi:unnamed protein product [Rotaria sordida]|uniref:Uncharacterized protein n=1 Tax=Rotaria sordida TaxID=392033 RepID=A0A819HVJ2_9BILA|nr:unnamed protein product [Rotaria sordida]